MRVRLRSQFQKDGYGAKAGQVIRGNLARGGDGQFTSAGNASAAKPKAKAKLSADELRAKREAEREERQAQRDAEREARRAQREAERQARLAQREAERQARLAQREAEKKTKEEAAKKKGGGGGGGKKKDDKADPKAAAQAKKEQGRKAEQRRKERQAERKDKARAAERQQAQAQRQAEAQQRRADTQARQQASAAERASRQQAQAQRQQASAAERAKRDAERKTRQAASDAARTQREADRKARQAAMDARRAKLDAAREKIQAQMAARRDAAEARANAKFGAWQKDQASKPKGGKDAKAPSAKDTKAPRAKDTTAGAAGVPPAPAPAPAPAPKRSRKERRRGRADVAQKSANIVLAKREASTRTFAHSFAIAKVDAEQRIVEGIASSEVPDRQPGLWKGAYYAGDIVAAEAIAAALPGYLEYGNIREMHQPSAVGVVLSAEMRERQLYLVVKVVDDAAWQKVVTGVYKGFSIGGACDDAEIIKEAGRTYRKITALTLTEISLVDRPANPAARFTLWKGIHMDPNEEAELQKAAGDPTKAIAALQQLRDAAELDGDLNAAQAYSLAIAAALEGAGIAQPDEEDAADEEEPAEEIEAPEDDLAMADGLDALPDDDAIVAMASRIGDIAKVGRSVSGANLAHLTSIHDAIKKIAGDALCKAEDVTPEPEAQVAQAQPSGDLQKVAGLEAQLAELQKRLEQVESQPVAGGPVLRAADKQLPGEQPAVASVRKSTRSRADLQRLSQTEPNAQLRAQYAAELAALDK